MDRQTYLVEITICLPQTLQAADREDLLARELRRGVELRSTGAIQHIWRVPGALRNVGIWTAADASQLHDDLASLPLFPYMTVSVTPLARHPVEVAVADGVPR